MSMVPDSGSQFAQESQRLTLVVSQAIGFLLRMVEVAQKSLVPCRFNVLVQDCDLDTEQEHIEKLYPKLRDSPLLRHLGLAMVERKQFIAHSRRKKEQQPKTGASTKAAETSLLDPDQEQRQAGSHSTSRSDDSSTTPGVSTHDFPALRKLSPNFAPFDCPICFTVQSFRDEVSWRSVALHLSLGFQAEH